MLSVSIFNCLIGLQSVLSSAGELPEQGESDDNSKWFKIQSNNKSYTKDVVGVKNIKY